MNQNVQIQYNNKPDFDKVTNILLVIEGDLNSVIFNLIICDTIYIFLSY